MTGLHRPLRRAGTTLLALLSLAVAGPAVNAAHAETNNGGGGPASCPLPNGTTARPGDYKTVVTWSVQNGRNTSTSRRSICGEDGKWHLVEEVASGGNAHWTGTKWRVTGSKWHVAVVSRSARRKA
jgi:hypothetical protein